MDLSILDAVLNGTPTSDPAALLEIIAEIPSARPAALYTLSSVLAALHTESTLAGKNGGERGGEHAAKRQRTDGGGGGAAEESESFCTHEKKKTFLSFLGGSAREMIPKDPVSCCNSLYLAA